MPNYYDLIINGNVVCLDGETCFVIKMDKDLVTLKNTEGETIQIFSLTKKEFEITASL